MGSARRQVWTVIELDRDSLAPYGSAGNRTESGTPATVVSFTVEATPSTMWDLTVDGAHSFFGGQGAVLVHNLNPLCDINSKIWRQMLSRGWTFEDIQKAFDQGDQVRAYNKVTGGPATRFINPDTGLSVVIDDTTQQVLQVDRPGMLHGPLGGDLP